MDTASTTQTKGLSLPNAWLEKPLGMEGSWELEANSASPCRSEKRGGSPQTCTSAKPAACPKEGEDEQRDGHGERHPQAGWTDRQMHIPVQGSRNQRMGAREIPRRPERASHPSENTLELRKIDPSALIQRVLIALQTYLFSEGLRNGQMQPKGWISPFPHDTRAPPAAVFPSSTRGKDPFPPTALKTQQEVSPRVHSREQLNAFHQCLRSCPEESHHIPAILKAPPELPCAGHALQAP